MRFVDVFNGDADGICALHQLRLANPVASTLVTGLKHDITLLDRVKAGDGDLVTVLDLSLERNRAGLAALLERGAIVHYFDHHYAGDVPRHPNLLTMLDAAGSTCTSELMDRHLDGRFRTWAVVGAFGDNYREAAVELARPLGLDAERLARLEELGNCLNYNAYGATEADVFVAPAKLYRTVSHYRDPFELLESEEVIARLSRERAADMARVAACGPRIARPGIEAYVLPDAAWSRRVMGTFANRLALDAPHDAHAVIVPLPDGDYGVSVRSPRGHGPSAVEFCRRFPTGGGRITAAGIQRLPAAQLEDFLERLAEAYAITAMH